MRKVAGILSVAMILAGCASPHKSAPKPAAAKATAAKATITPDFRPVGEVVSMNAASRFVVISFPPGSVPKSGDRLSVYHRGLKAAEVRVTSWERDNNIVADILTGDVQPRDEARSE